MKKLIILSLILFVLAGCTAEKQGEQKALGIEEIKVKAAQFINDNLMQAGSKVSIKEVTEDEGLYKIVVNAANNQEITSYMSKDGLKFFPQVMEVQAVEAETQKRKAQEDATQASQNVSTPKKEKPEVEVFVMSHCPYGTQIEKGIIPVIEKLSNKIDFKLKFCDYAMHGKTELDEQLQQYCIQREESQKLIPYLKCFLEEGDSERCALEVKLSTSKISACIASTDKEYKVTESFNDKSTWTNGRYPIFDVNKEEAEQYGVKGSPNLIINGQKVASGRDSASLLKAVCAGFNETPAECDAELDSTTPAPGFGYDGSGSDTNAGCGS